MPAQEESDISDPSGGAKPLPDPAVLTFFRPFWLPLAAFTQAGPLLGMVRLYLDEAAPARSGGPFFSLSTSTWTRWIFFYPHIL